MGRKVATLERAEAARSAILDQRRALDMELEKAEKAVAEAASALAEAKAAAAHVHAALADAGNSAAGAALEVQALDADLQRLAVVADGLPAAFNAGNMDIAYSTLRGIIQELGSRVAAALPAVEPRAAEMPASSDSLGHVPAGAEVAMAKIRALAAAARGHGEGGRPRPTQPGAALGTP